jgi:hypothetical protein
MSEVVSKIVERAVRHSEGHQVVAHKGGADKGCERELEEEEEEEEVLPAAQPLSVTDWTSYRAALTARCVADLGGSITKVGLVWEDLLSLRLSWFRGRHSSGVF